MNYLFNLYICYELFDKYIKIMAKISRKDIYPVDTVLQPDDSWVGTDFTGKKTKTYTLKDVAAYVGSSGNNNLVYPAFVSRAEATVQLGVNHFFRWTQNNIDGVPSPGGSQIGITTT